MRPSPLRINSGLDGFVLVERITAAEADRIHGVKSFCNAPVFLGIETLAQLGAYHVRFLSDFKKHAFLLKINHSSTCSSQHLNGACTLSGRLLNRSASAFSYALTATQGGQTILNGKFMFATVDYDTRFNQEILENHYRKVFSCLQRDSRKN